MRKTHLSLNSPPEIIVTCEHGGTNVPREYVHLFTGRKKLLNSHKSYDRGAIELAKVIAGGFDARLYCSTTTRLLVDLNRSEGHPKLFSAISRKLDRRDRHLVLERYYRPYRNSIESFIAGEIITGKTVLHFAVHTFTPVLNGVRRRTDIGLLYDPSRTKERAICISLQKALTLNNRLTVRRNYPYLGRTDGLVTYFRKRFSGDRYIGMELEINQKYVTGDKTAWKELKFRIIKALTSVIASTD